MRICIALVLLLGVPQDSDVARWIDDLGHEDIERREAAIRHLMERGEKLSPTLKKALETAKAPAVRAILERIEQAIQYSRERRRELALVNFGEGSIRFADFAAGVEAQTDYKVTGAVDPNARVSVRGSDQPLRQVLDSLERQLNVTFEIPEREYHKYLAKPGRIERGGRLHVPGATFDAKKHRIEEDGQFIGWAVDLAPVGYPDATLESVEIEDADGMSLDIETCIWCSPNRVFVRTQSPDLKVRARVDVLWNRSVDLKVEEPSRPRDFRVGPFVVHYEFLKVRITSDRPLDSRQFPKVSFTVERKDGDFCGGGHWSSTIG